MSEILFHYHKVNPTTWVYLSSLLTIALFFKFSRVWSVRNLDLVALIMLAPGLLCVKYGETTPDRTIEQLGYIWLFATGGFFLIRMLLDPLMVRRPLLEPNLSVGGMTFLGASLLVFLMANVVTSQPDRDDLAAASTDSAAAPPMANEQALSAEELSQRRFATQGPGYALLQVVPSFSTRLFVKEADSTAQTDQQRQESRHAANEATARTMAILSHLAVVFGMVMIGYRHFDNIKTGIAAAVLYLLLPYTALYTGKVTHVLPAALIVWAIAGYRRPLVAGMLLGLSMGAAYYPAFLLPLWAAFYWQRGLVRFSVGVVSMLLLLVGVLAWNASSTAELAMNIRHMFGLVRPTMAPVGFWGIDTVYPAYRITVLAAFVAMCGSLAIWPAQKNLGTLLSCSAAVMLGTQFWNAYGGGLYMAWYLPLLLLTIFRPNLEDRVALAVLGEWRPKRHLRVAAVDQAA